MPSTRADKKCGASYIPNTAKCSKGSGVGTAVKAVATAGVIAGGAVALKSRLGSKRSAVTTFKMQPTMGLKVSRATTAGMRRHKTAVNKGSRRHKAAILKARRKYEPDFMKKRSKRAAGAYRLGSFYKDGHARTKSVRDRMAKIMDSYKKPRY